MSLSYALVLTEYSPHVGCKYTSNFTHHSITNLKLLTIFYDCCFSGLCCYCGLNCETAITRNATSRNVETMCYFNRKIGLPDLGIAGLRVAIYLHLTTTKALQLLAFNSIFRMEFNIRREIPYLNAPLYYSLYISFMQFLCIP